MKKDKRRWRRWPIWVGLLLLAGIYGYIQNNWIEIERVAVPVEALPPAFHGYKIAHISDVHLGKHAASIDRLIQLVGEQEPDLIVMTGDLVDQGTSLETSGLDRLSSGLSRIAATYAVTGNHEHVAAGRAEQWREIVTSNGVRVLDNQVEWLVRSDARLLIAGLEDNSRYSPEVYAVSANESDTAMLLLAHRPELFANYADDNHSLQPDLVFSGHAHGGQFRIPLLNQGIVAPNQGLLPSFTAGLYRSDNGVQMMVSRGLGNSIIPVRIHNRPHLPIIELIEAARVE